MGNWSGQFSIQAQLSRLSLGLPLPSSEQPSSKMTVFEVKSKKYLIIKILITQICITVFILQSYQEVIKFFRSLTSVSIRTEAVVDLQYPTIVICLKEPFKVRKRVAELAINKL